MTESSATSPVPQTQAVPATGNGGAAAGGPPPLPADAPAVPPVPADMAPAPIVYAPPGFWEQPWVQDVMPFVTSVTVHAAVIVIGLIVFGVYKSAIPTAHQDQIIIPDASLANETPPGGVPNEGTGENPLQASQQDKDVDQAASAFADKKGPSADLTSGGSSGDDPASVITIGAAGGFDKGKGLLGANSGSGAGDSAAMAAFGAPGGGGSGPKGPVFGNGGNAKKIVFVCDATGTMVPKASALRIQLSKTVQDLRVSQSFDVIFFNDEHPAIAFSAWSKQPGVLMMANSSNKVALKNFIETIVSKLDGGPLAGVEMALKEKPDLIYVLTDGEFPDSEKAVEIIRKLNKDHIKINTIAFINGDDVKHHVDVGFKKVLKAIATDNGGTFNDVNPDDL